MISSFKKFFENTIKTGPGNNESGHGLQIATAALLLEISRADYDVKPEEQQMVINAIRSKFGLSREETEELIELADREIRESSSYHEFTSLINQEFTPEQKIRIVEHLWEVAFADEEIEKHEEHLIRKIAKLLYVPHKAFIEAKLRVKKRLGDQTD